MNCAWLKERLPRPEVELWRHGRPSAVLLEHARTCAECAQTIESEAHVKALLLTLGETTQTAEPSPHVHARLLVEMEERVQERLVPQKKWAWLRGTGLRWALATAAGAVVAWLVLYNTVGQEQQQPQPAPPVVANATASPSRNPAVVPSTASEPKGSGKMAQPKVQSPAAVQEAPLTAEAAQPPVVREQGYYPLVMCDAYSCEGDAVEVRVKVPAPSLWLSGNSRTSGNVDAQLLVGEDGVVRGIKFVE